MGMNKETTVRLVDIDGNELDADKHDEDMEAFILENLDSVMKFEDFEYQAQDGFIIISGTNAAGEEEEPVYINGRNYPYVYHTIDKKVMMHFDR